jgi:hypothetical protein
MEWACVSTPARMTGTARDGRFVRRFDSRCSFVSVVSADRIHRSAGHANIDARGGDRQADEGSPWKR